MNSIEKNYKGYTKNVINQLTKDTVDELRNFLIKGEKGSKKHIELSNRVQSLSSLALAR